MPGFITFFLHMKKSFTAYNIGDVFKAHKALIFLFTIYGTAIGWGLVELLVALGFESIGEEENYIYTISVQLASVAFCYFFIIRDKTYKWLSFSYAYIIAYAVLVAVGVSLSLFFGSILQDRTLKRLSQPPTFIRADTSSQSHPSDISRRPL